ncbi:MAG TPA: mechanosensitive ion channel family protein [Desulfuromonadales bacterium]
MHFRSIFHVVVLVASCLTLGLSGLAAAAEEPAELLDVESALAGNTAPVVVDGVTLFRVRGIGAFPAEKRAEAISERIVALAADRSFPREALRLEEEAGATLIMADKKRIMGVFEADARLEGIDRQTLAQSYRSRTGEAIEAWRHDRAPGVLKRNVLFALGATLLLALALRIGFWIYRRLGAWLEVHLRSKFQGVQIRKFQLVRGEQLWQLFTGARSLFWAVVVLAAIYLYLFNVLSLFPWTRGLGKGLVDILINPLRIMGLGLLKAVPDLVFLLVFFFVTRYVLKLVRLFFAGVADGTVVLPEFEAEWAWPTFRLVRLLLIAFALIVAYPYIPGSDSGAFKGVSLFIGVLFSLGSSSLIGNLIAGYSMTYRRAFRIGDRIRVGEHIGDVEQRRLLVTHLRTPKNEEVVIPNSTILGGEVVNYSTLARQQGLILHTTVGIGYETPWRQVEAMLLEAASRTAGLLREPAPFVLQKALGDFCVTYEINVYCSKPQEMGPLYSELHRSILDVFNEYGVQIMTPAYEGDPEQPKVVSKEKWYTAPAKPPER